MIFEDEGFDEEFWINTDERTRKALEKMHNQQYMRFLEFKSQLIEKFNFVDERMALFSFDYFNPDFTDNFFRKEFLKKMKKEEEKDPISGLPKSMFYEC